MFHTGPHPKNQQVWAVNFCWHNVGVMAEVVRYWFTTM